MTIKELKEKLNQFDENLKVKFAVFDEYECEVEGVKFKDIKQGYGDTVYLFIRAGGD